MTTLLEAVVVVRVLAGWTGPQYDFNAVFPRGRVQSPKVRAFVDFLVERLNLDADYMQVLCPAARCREAMVAAANDGPAEDTSEMAAVASLITAGNLEVETEPA